MEVWSWVLVVVALLLLGAGTLRFDWLSAAVRQRLVGGGAVRTDAPSRGVSAHHAAAHTGHVAHAGPRRRPHFHRSGKRH